MQILATAEQMREVEGAAVRKYGIPSLLLMENAGRAFADYLEGQFESIAGLTVAITSDPNRPARSHAHAGDLHALVAEELIPAARAA